MNKSLWAASGAFFAILAYALAYANGLNGHASELSAQGQGARAAQIVTALRRATNTTDNPISVTYRLEGCNLVVKRIFSTRCDGEDFLVKQNTAYLNLAELKPDVRFFPRGGGRGFVLFAFKDDIFSQLDKISNTIQRKVETDPEIDRKKSLMYQSKVESGLLQEFGISSHEVDNYCGVSLVTAVKIGMVVGNIGSDGSEIADKLSKYVKSYCQ